MERKLIEAALEDGSFDRMTFQCPECSDIDDDEYCCTTCWCTPGTMFNVTDVIKALLMKEVE